MKSSKGKCIIELDSPSCPDLRRELIVMRGLVCNVCAGRGFNFDYHGKDKVQVLCGYCGGAGMLKARVTVEWAKPVESGFWGLDD